MRDYIGPDKNKFLIAGYYGPMRTTTREEFGHPAIPFDTVTEEIFQMIKEVGIDLITRVDVDCKYPEQRKTLVEILELAEKYDLGVFVEDSRIDQNCDEETFKQCIEDYIHYSSFKGGYGIDEPFTEHYGYQYWSKGRNRLEDYENKTSLFNKYNIYASSGPNAMSYQLWKGGQLPWDVVGESYLPYTSYREELKKVYTEYIEEYIATYGERMLAFAYYVFDGVAIGGCLWNRMGYFDNLSVIRELALKYNVAFKPAIAAGSNWNDARIEMSPDVNPGKHPTQQELFWNVNTVIAYGARGISYFPIIQPYYFAYTKGGKFDFNRNGLIGADGSKTRWYEPAKIMNKWISTVGDMLVHATSKEIVVVGEVAQHDTSITRTSYGPLQSVGAYIGAIIGVFEYEDKTLYYVVNYSTDLKQTVVLHLEESYQYVAKVQTTDVNAIAREIEGTDDTIKLDIEAGGAALVILERRTEK